MTTEKRGTDEARDAGITQAEIDACMASVEGLLDNFAGRESELMEEVSQLMEKVNKKYGVNPNRRAVVEETKHTGSRPSGKSLSMRRSVS